MGYVCVGCDISLGCVVVMSDYWCCDVLLWFSGDEYSFFWKCVCVGWDFEWLYVLVDGFCGNC